MARYRDEEEYREALRGRGPFPEGFRAATAGIRFHPAERPGSKPAAMNLALVSAEEPTSSFAAVFTRNAFPGAPVIIGRAHLQEELLQGVLVNNKISNVRSPTGLRDARRLAAETGRAVAREQPPSGRNSTDEPPDGGLPFLSVSTGVIGWGLPVREMCAAVPDLASAWGHGLPAGSATPADPLAVAEAIMTTDSFPKLRSCNVGNGRILGIAKGAGMVEPNLATMLVFITTDISIPREELREDLASVLVDTFNAISIDGDQSTSDTVLAWSSNRKPRVSRGDFRAALHEVCWTLAEDIVRNGEGVGHVVRVGVSGAGSSEDADTLARGVANSPLVKTAVYGNDPNVGRIVAALGDAAGNNNIDIDPESVTIRLGTETIFANGVFHLDRDKERRLCDYLRGAAMNPVASGFPEHEEQVCIDVNVALGSADAAVLGTDLSYEYIRENADYRT